MHNKAAPGRANPGAAFTLLISPINLEDLLAVHVALDVVQGLAEVLEVDHLALPEELQAILQVRIVGEPDQVLVGRPGFLLCSHILMQVGDWVAHGVDVGAAPGDTVGVAEKQRIVPDGIVATVVRIPDLGDGSPSGQLVDHGGDHLPVGQFLGADVGQDPLAPGGRHGVALGEIPDGGGEFSVRPAELPVLYSCVIVLNSHSRRNMTFYIEDQLL